MAAGQRGGAMSKGGRGGAGRGGASRGGAGRGGRGGSRGGRGGQKGRNGNNERKAPPLPVITDEDEDDMPVDEDDIEFLREYGAHAKFLESMDADTLLKPVDKGKVIRPEVSDPDLPDINSDSDDDDEADGDEGSEEDDDEDDEDDGHESLSRLEDRHRVPSTAVRDEETRLPVKGRDGVLQANKRELVIDDETLSPVQLSARKNKQLERQIAQREERRAASAAKVAAEQAKAAALKMEGELPTVADRLPKGPAVAELTDEEIADYMKTAMGRNAFLSVSKERLASLAAAITQNPEGRLEMIGQVRQLCNSPHPTVNQLALLTSAAIFKDILPGYRIRELSEAEKAVKVSGDVAKLRKFESTLLRHYQVFLQDCERILQSHRKHQSARKKKAAEEEADGKPAYTGPTDGVATAAMQCLCEMLITKINFNFSSNILTSVVARLATANPPGLAERGLTAIRTLFTDDEHGEASLEATKIIYRFIKARSFNAPAPVLEVFLSLRLIDDLEPESDESSAPGGKKQKTQKQHLSRKKRKLTKEEKELERDLREADAEVDREERKRLHTETLKIVFQTYFKILKNLRQSPLIPTVLAGLARFAHLINVEFMADLLVVLRQVASDPHVSLRSALHCVITAFRLSRGQGEALMLDMKEFYYVLYRMLPSLPTSANADVELALTAISTTLQQIKSMSTDRVAAFVKRMVHISTQLEPHAALAVLSVAHRIMQAYPRVAGLLDTEQTGNGVYRYDIDDPDLAAPFASALWDFAALQKHYHPTLAKLAVRIARNQPGMQGTPSDIFRLYNWRGGASQPPTPAPAEHPLTRAMAKQPGRAMFLLAPVATRPFMRTLEARAEADLKDSEEYAGHGGLHGHFVANALLPKVEALQEREEALAQALKVARQQAAERKAAPKRLDKKAAVKGSGLKNERRR